MESAVHSHRDFLVRRSVVHRALNWLVTHNQYYRSNHVHIDVNALEQLPHDGNLSQLTSITVESRLLAADVEPHALLVQFYHQIVYTCIYAEPKITSGQRSISVQTTERTAQMITRPVIMTGRVNTLRSID